MKGHRKVAFLYIKTLKFVANNNWRIEQSAVKFNRIFYTKEIEK